MSRIRNERSVNTGIVILLTSPVNHPVGNILYIIWHTQYVIVHGMSTGVISKIAMPVLTV